MAKETAEEKLLKMMQKSAASVAVKPQAVAPVKNKFKLSFSISALNVLLFFGIVACLLGLGFEMQSGVALLHQASDIPPVSATSGASSDVSLLSIQGVDHYLQKVNERNIFKPYVAKVAKNAAVQGLVQLMSKYKLVGIAWLDLPETASIMIEDTQKKTTFFLKQGEKLEGVTVKTIYTDRAVFSHENEETTIKL